MDYETRAKVVLPISIAMNVLLGVFGNFDYLSDVYQEVINVFWFVDSGDGEAFECVVLHYTGQLSSYFKS